MRTGLLAAIVAIGCHSIRIAGNLVDQGRVAERIGRFAAGIASSLGFGQLDVSGNTVDRVSAETSRSPDENLGASIALLVEDLQTSDQPIIVDDGATRYLVTPNAIYARVIRRPTPSTTSVRGNKLNGAGAFPAVVVGLVSQKYDVDLSRFGPLTFAENFCELDDVQDSDLGPVAVTLAAQALVLPDNQVRSSWRGEALAVRAMVDMIREDQPAVTATGNITEGDIVVNGPVLQPPWMALNIRLS